MSIDKWLSQKDQPSTDSDIKKEEIQLSEEELDKLKKQKIRQLVKKSPKKESAPKNTPNKNKDFLEMIVDFKEWLNQRNYLKGDLSKIETWIKNLHHTLNTELSQIQEDQQPQDKTSIFNKIPPEFIEEKMRIAINKKLRDVQLSKSDNYYIKKLMKIVQDKLKEAEYYEILKKLLE